MPFRKRNQGFLPRQLAIEILVFVIVSTFTTCSEALDESKHTQYVLTRGHHLKKSLIKEESASDPIDCTQLCYTKTPQCKSVNYGTSSRTKAKCQLNNSTATCDRSNLVVDEDFDYWEEEMNDDSSYCPAQPNKPQQIAVPKSCADSYKNGVKSDGVYTIDPDDQGAFDVRCDMTTDGGGWTVFQKRMDGSEDFYLNWTDYKNGFGNLSGEFWLGLDKINRLSESGQDVLRVDLEDFENNTTYAKYNIFAMADETYLYKLTVRNYSGNAGDSLAYHNGRKFSTKDKDNDATGGNCAMKHKGAWWYTSCQKSNLNALYLPGRVNRPAEIVSWFYWRGNKYSLKTTEMKIRPRNI